MFSPQQDSPHALVMSSLRDVLPAPRNTAKRTGASAEDDGAPHIARDQTVVAGASSPGVGVSSVLHLTAGADGSADFSAIARGGGNASRVVHAAHGAIVEKVRDEELANQLVLPDAEALAETAKRTQAALDPIVRGNVAASLPSNFRGRESNGTQAAEFVRYTPASTNRSHNSGAEQRIIKMVQAPVDPMEPPRFSQKKTPVAPPSPPVPVLHSPARKISKQEAADWVVPPAISNWKNNRGYTVPLDKRLASDAASHRDSRINDKFAALAETMYVAERTAREQVEQRAQIQRNVSLKAKEAKEKQLRNLAARARDERAGLGTWAGAHTGGTADTYDAQHLAATPGQASVGAARPTRDPPAPTTGTDAHGGSNIGNGRIELSRSGAGSSPSIVQSPRRSRGSRFGSRTALADGVEHRASGGGSQSGDAEARRRDEIREERRRERDRELRMREHHGEDSSGRPTLKRSKLSRDRDRDMSERVALGQRPSEGSSGEAMYDQRLFNQGSSVRGMAAGFGGEDADAVYDRPLFDGGNSQSKFQYRPNGAMGSGNGRNLEDSIDDQGTGTARFKPAVALGDGDGGGSGDAMNVRDGPRSRPVEFEHDSDLTHRSGAEPTTSPDPFGLNNMFGRMSDSKLKKRR